jgi:predicted DCC family thiol-disulfide oxidoreductase YuxK
MGGRAVQVQQQGGSGVHLVLFDGVCGLCDRLVQFTLQHDRRAVFDFASLQSATGHEILRAKGRDIHDLTTFLVVVNYQTIDRRVLVKSDAALFLLGELGWPWRAARLFQRLPHVISNPLYDVIARNRYRLFGKRERCRLPAGGVRTRFIDT